MINPVHPSRERAVRHRSFKSARIAAPIGLTGGAVSAIQRAGKPQVRITDTSAAHVTLVGVCCVRKSASAPPTPLPPRLPAIDQPAAAPLCSFGSVVAISASTAADDVATAALAMNSA